MSIRGKSLLAAIGAVLAAASINVGCLLPNSPMCSNGTVCPVGGACDEANGVCFTPAELAACTGVAEGGDCVLSEVLGTCSSGGCRLGNSAWSVTAPIGAGPVWARNPADAYVRGYWSDGYNSGLTLSHWDGTSWSPLEEGGALISDRGADSVLDGGGRLVLIRDGSNWFQLPYNLWAISPDDAFGIGSITGSLSHWDGKQWATLWTNLASATSSPLAPLDFLTGVWASGPDDVFVVGFGIGHWDGAVMTLADGSTDVAWGAVWGSGPNDVYAVGDVGTIAHWNGARWSRMTSGTDHTLRAVHGSGADDVFVGGNGVLLRLHNGAWETIYVPGFTDIYGLWVTPSRVFVVGAEGEVHIDRPR